jgi:autotransporter-associated beta strand protein
MMSIQIENKTLRSFMSLFCAPFRASAKRVALVLAILWLIPNAAQAAITWAGTVNNTWDNTTANWTGDSTTFTDDNSVNVIFDKAAGGTISISANMSPLSTTVNSSGTYTFNGGPIDSGSFIKSGTGTLDLTGANTFSNGLNIKAGTVRGANALSFGAAGITLGDTSGNNAATLSVNASSGITYNNPAITVANGTSGTLTIAMGNQIGGSSAFSQTLTGAIALNNNLSVSCQVANPLTLSGLITEISDGTGYTITVNGNANDRVKLTGGIVIGTGGLTLQNNGSLFTIGTRNITSTTTGNLTFNSNSGGGFTVSAASINNSGNILVTGTGTGGTTISGVIGANVTGGVIQNNPNSTLTLSGANTFTGGLYINAGTVVLGNVQAAGSGTPNITLGDATVGSNATLRMGTTPDGQTILGNITVASGTGTRTLSGNTVNSLGGTFSGSITLNHDLIVVQPGQSNPRAMTLSGSISGTGNISLQPANNTAATGIILNNTAGGINNTGTITNTGTFATISGNIGSNVTVVVQNSANSALILSGINTHANTLVSLGTLRFTGGSSSNSVVAVTSGATNDVQVNYAIAGLNNVGGVGGIVLNNKNGSTNTLTLVGADTYSFAGILANGTNGVATTLSLTKAGSGTQTLSGANTYSGLTTVSGGTLKLGVFNAIANNGAMTVTGGIYDLGGLANVTNGAVTLSGGAISNGTLTGASYVLSNGTSYAALAGVGALVKNGIGTATLAGANTYSGVTAVSNGTLLVDGSLASGSAVTVESGATLGGSGTVNGTVSVSSGGILTAGGVGTMGKLTMTNSVTLNSSVLKFDVINAGTAGVTYDQIAVTNLVLNGANSIALNPTSGTITNGTYTLMTYTGKTGSGTLKLQNGATTYGNLTLTDNGSSVILTVSADTAFNVLWKGTVNGLWDTTTANWTNTVTGAFQYLDSANVTFNDTATATTISGGTVTPGSMTFNNTSKNYTVSNSIAGAGSVAKSGTGSLTLTGASTYSGKTTVNAGTVSFTTLANAGSASALGAPTVDNATIDLGSGTTAATLQYSGTGASTSDRTINLAGTTGGATIFIGAGTGLLTLNGNVTATGSGAKTLTVGLNNNNLSVVMNGTIPDSSGGATSLSVGPGGSGTAMSLTLGSTASSYTGPTTVTRGILNVYSIKNVNGGNSSLGNPSMGNGTLNVGASETVELHYKGTGDTTDRVINLAGTGTLKLFNEGSGLLKFTSDWTATGTGNKTILLQTGNFELGGAIPDSASGGTNSLTVQFVTACTLSATNSSYSGATLVAGGGAVTIKSINKIGSNSSLGTGANVAGGTITIGNGANGGILVYNGTGSGIGNEGITDRMIKLDGSGSGVIDQSGTGLLKFTGALTATAGTRPLTLQGSTSGSGEISGVISNGAATAINITKLGTGTWTLSGTNTYTGTTTVTAGTLKAGIASAAGYGALGTNSAVTLANAVGAVLDLNGFNTAIGSLTGGGASGGNVVLGTNTLTIGSNNTSPAAFAGIISGTGGNLIKVGTGTNTLSGVNTYTGTTTVNVGTLGLMTNTNCLSAASSVVIATGAKMYLNFTGTNTITSLKLGGIGMGKGVYNASNQSTFLTGTGALNVLVGPANGTLIRFY